MPAKDFDGADALPLLAFTLQRLVPDHGEDGRLKLGDYIDEMKGVGGAIRKAVEIAFGKAAEIPGLPRTRSELDALAQRAFVPGLVRVDDPAAPPKKRAALRSRLPQEALPLIDCLVDQRLLVADMEGTEPTVEVAHEAVLRHWPELEGWIGLRRDELSLSERVRAAARDWRTAQSQNPQGAAEALVHRGERLLAAEKLMLWDDLRRDMGDDSMAYIAACRDAENRQKRRQRRLWQWIGGLVIGAAVITALGAALVIAGQRNLGRAQSLTLARAAERLLQDGDPLRALRLSILAAQENGLLPASPESHAALSSSAQALKLAAEFRGHLSEVWGAAFSADESRILTWSQDHTARLWDAATGAQIGPDLAHDGSVWGAVFSQDERRILTWSNDYTARLWDAATGAQIGPALVHGGTVNGAAFSADERRILTWSSDSTARLWDAATGAQIGPALAHDSVRGAAFSADESRILTWGGDSTARLWDAATGAQIGPALSPVSDAAFSADESRILTWSGDTARLWDAATGAQIGPALVHNDRVDGAVFSQDERRILTWSWDNTARLWDAATGAQIGPALSPVSDAAFSADESRILTWSGDTARLWDAATGAQIGPALDHDGPVDGASFSADESRILTWSFDSTARLRDAATGAQIGPTLAHDRSVLGAVFSQDERRTLTWTQDNARLWDAETGAQIGPALAHDGWVSGAAFSRDERRILTWSGDNTARLFDVSWAMRDSARTQYSSPISAVTNSWDGPSFSRQQKYP